MTGPVAARRARTLRDLADRPLSDVELTVMDLVADGLRNPEVAAALGVPVTTVKAHLTRISMRFPTGDRAGMVGCLYLSRVFRRREPDPGAPPPVVSARQHRVLVGVARGGFNGEIAQSTGIPLDTVRMDVSSLMRLLGARNRTHLVRLAVDAGVLRLVPPARGGDDGA